MSIHVDWNLEIAHVNWGDKAARESVEEALTQGKDWIDRWQADSATFVVCCLVDDKEIDIANREVWLTSHLNEFPQLFDLLDYVCFESDLISLKDEFLARFEPPRRGKVERELERYRSKHGRVACSHDIAIWHTLRLGLLPSGQDLMRPLKVRRKGPYGHNILSILEEEDRAPEDRALEILGYAADVVRKRINLEFYA